MDHQGLDRNIPGRPNATEHPPATAIHERSQRDNGEEGYSSAVAFGQDRGPVGGRAMNEIRAEAMRLARNAAKRDIRDQGFKLHDYSACDLRIAGERWLDCHPELIEQATITFLRYRAKLESAAQKKKPEKAEGSAVQNSGAK
jgi:hypothetical protein